MLQGVAMEHAVAGIPLQSHARTVQP